MVGAPRFFVPGRARDRNARMRPTAQTRARLLAARSSPLLNPRPNTATTPMTMLEGLGFLVRLTLRFSRERAIACRESSRSVDARSSAASAC